MIDEIYTQLSKYLHDDRYSDKSAYGKIIQAIIDVLPEDWEKQQVPPGMLKRMFMKEKTIKEGKIDDAYIDGYNQAIDDMRKLLIEDLV
jgi:hypothetical protein